MIEKQKKEELTKDPKETTSISQEVQFQNRKKKLDLCVSAKGEKMNRGP